MTWLIAFLCLIPTLYEAWSDRKGEDRKGKRKDFIWLSLVALAFAAGTWLVLGYNPLAVLSLILGWRILVFDYLTNALLKGYSESHRDINVWSYTGKTAYFDRLIKNVPWGWRLGIRGLVFALAVWWYCTIL